MQLHLTSSAQRAAAIWSAWNNSDAAGLRQELSRVEAARTGVSDSLEAERLDLLVGIASELSQQGASADICGRLLQHTAATALAGRSPSTPLWFVLQ